MYTNSLAILFTDCNTLDYSGGCVYRIRYQTLELSVTQAGVEVTYCLSEVERVIDNGKIEWIRPAFGVVRETFSMADYPQVLLTNGKVAEVPNYESLKDYQSYYDSFRCCSGDLSADERIVIYREQVVAVADRKGQVKYVTGIQLKNKDIKADDGIFRAPESGTYTISSSKIEMFKGKIIDIPKGLQISRVYLGEFVEPDVANPETKVDPAFRHMLGLNEE
jgi:hypothetical protein